MKSNALKLILLFRFLLNAITSIVINSPSYVTVACTSVILYAIIFKDDITNKDK
jgi:hypothetical protein